MIQMRTARFTLAVLLTGFIAGRSGGQATPTPTPNQAATNGQDTQGNSNSSASDRASLAPPKLLKNFAEDQKDIWTSPFKARVADLNWLLPLTGLTAGLVNADAEMSSRLSRTGTLPRYSGTASNAGVGVALAGSGGLWLLGRWRDDRHQQETGILALEAATDSLVVNEAVKLATERDRPLVGTGRGDFFHGGGLDSSFASSHAAVTWSIASVVAHEYPGTLTKLLAYGLATGVSVSRVTAKDHFASDAVAGSAIGWLIGRQVYNRHHDATLDGLYGNFEKGPALKGEEHTPSIASPYVDLDSWVYPAFERLSALGVIPSGLLGLRPWTRRECARLLDEAAGAVDDTEPDEAFRLYQALADEFAPEMNQEDRNYIGIDSLYARATPISGRPLTDGYHFNRTIVNDFGRPFEKGFNGLAGVSASSSIGPLGFYVRGEFDHAPAGPAISQALQNALQLADAKTTNAALAGPPIFQQAAPVAAVDRFRLLDSYVMLNFRGWQSSFGKQSLWTGPARDAFLSSDNAEPMYMFRLDQTLPMRLPSIFRFLGPFRIEAWVGKLGGQHYVNTQDPSLGVVYSLGRSLAKQPMLNGQKINFKPTENFEFGIGKTGLWGGPDFPITAKSTRLSFFSTGNGSGRNNDPGDRRSTFDFNYRIPGLRKWLILYGDSFTEDEISPIAYPRDSAMDDGLYMPQIPKLRHMDLRVEGGYTDLPNFIQPIYGGYFYWNIRYLDGYTNRGNIIGSMIGRQGISFRAASTYWFASDKTIQVSYRNVEASPQFLQGGNLRDVEVHSDWSLGSNVRLTGMLQYEWWNYPILSAGNKQSNFAAQLQVTYWPRWRINGKKQEDGD